MSEIKKYKFKEGLPLEFEILSLKEVFAKSRELLVSAHRLSFYQILWMEAGHAHHQVDFKSVELKSNDVLFIGKDQVQYFDPSGKYDGKLLLFTADFFGFNGNDARYLINTPLFNEFLGLKKIDLNKVPDIFIRLFREMEKELNNKTDGGQATILKNYLHNFLLLSEREIERDGTIEKLKGSDADYFIMFRDALSKNFRKHKLVSDYARLLHVSERRLNKATSNITGRSPKEIIDERVLLEANRLLAHTTLTIKEVAFDLGFDEPTNFIKYYKKQQQKTPTEFREAFGL